MSKKLRRIEIVDTLTLEQELENYVGDRSDEDVEYIWAIEAELDRRDYDESDPWK